MRLLTNLRCLGHLFNPVSFYYCFDRAGEGLQAVVAEVTNTPWGERHAYVLGVRSEDGGVRERVDKVFHVSPFMAMDHEYELCLTPPGRHLGVEIVSRKDGEVHFDASLQLERARARRAGPAARAAPPAGADAGGGRAHLRQRGAAEAQGRAVLRPPARGAAMTDRLARALVHRLLRLVARGRARAARARPPGRALRRARSGRSAAGGARGPLPRLLPRAAARERRPRRGAHGRPVVEPRPRRARAASARATARRSIARAAGCAR